MAHLFLDAHLELRSPTSVSAVTPSGSHVNVYFSSIELQDSILTVVIAIPAPRNVFKPLHPHGTRVQVIGWADLVGDTIFVKGPTLFPTELPAGAVPPCVSFSGVLTHFGHSAFGAQTGIGRLWPPPVPIRCQYDPWAEQLYASREPVPGSLVAVSGAVVGFDAGSLLIAIHSACFDQDRSSRGTKDLILAIDKLSSHILTLMRRFKEVYGSPRASNLAHGDLANAQSDFASCQQFDDDAFRAELLLLGSVEPSRVSTLDKHPGISSAAMYSTVDPGIGQIAFDGSQAAVTGISAQGMSPLHSDSSESSISPETPPDIYPGEYEFGTFAHADIIGAVSSVRV
ncbi:hypothetical protein AURDEDRAFT_176436 [Auricularia subglabra TFB-10046 SS5]|uniref:Uncharacterized protein n=1 Tax=Auricularia subglabra (strain TFB-10046 / SS5) TaxID=717982 RepID=J0WRE5_AURST|nr:hypothetical protein AURDEDRAFT_176436 [Auricularia subglabra TFB-10046 SS5]